MVRYSLDDLVALVKTRGQIDQSAHAPVDVIRREIRIALRSQVALMTGPGGAYRVITVLTTTKGAEAVQLPEAFRALEILERLDGSEWRPVGLRYVPDRTADYLDEDRDSPSLPGFAWVEGERLILRPLAKGGDEIRVTYRTEAPKLPLPSSRVELPTGGEEYVSWCVVKNVATAPAIRQQALAEMPMHAAAVQRHMREITGLARPRRFDDYLRVRPPAWRTL